MRAKKLIPLLILAGAAPALAQGRPTATPAGAAAGVNVAGAITAGSRAQAPAAAPAESTGGEHARVVIEEYADFQCPYCAAHEMQFGSAVRRWVRAQKGAVRLDFYDVALRQHAAAAAAAHAARCAGAQGRYVEARHELFATQQEWADSWNSVERVGDIARATVPHARSFDRCMAADPTSIYATLSANLQRGRDLGIPGTPTFVIRIGGRTAQIVDPVSADSLAKVVRSLERAR